MAAVGVEEDSAVLAARILLTLRNRKLRRWPEWVPKDPEPDQPAAASVAGEGGRVRFPPRSCPKRHRSGNRRRRGLWPSSILAVSTGSGACSSASEERERSPRWRETRSAGRDELSARRPGSPAYYRAPATGSGPSTSASADRKALLRHAAAVERVVKAPTPAAVPPQKERPMKASSPETPLDFGAGSGASSSGEDAAGSTTPSKRKAPETLGSAVACSSDEGCSSPDKRARVDDVAGGEAKKASISEPKVQTLDTEKKTVKFEFDLNMPWPEDDDASPGFC